MYQERKWLRKFQIGTPDSITCKVKEVTSPQKAQVIIYGDTIFKLVVML